MSRPQGMALSRSSSTESPSIFHFDISEMVAVGLIEVVGDGSGECIDVKPFKFADS